MLRVEKRRGGAQDRKGEKRLVAYVVGENQPASSELRSYLRERLPEYMVPAAFVRLERCL